MDLVGLIPAAGAGVRAYPYTETIPKSMLEVDGVPLLQRNVELMRDQLGIRDIRIVVGHQGNVIRRYFGDGAAFGVRLIYVTNERIDLELPYSVFLGGRDIDGFCCMILADECYVGTNHAELVRHPYASALATCGVMMSEYPKQIRKNYTVALRDGCIVDLVEKPATVTSRLMGVGTYVLHPDVFRRLEAAFTGGGMSGPKDWTSWLGSLARDGERILPFELAGQYVNINSGDDLNYANALVRDLTFETKRTSVVYVIDGPEQGAERAIARYAELPEVDEVVAVARQPSAGLARAAEHDKVRVLGAAAPGTPVGDLVKLGLEGATGDILLLSYSDDTFAARDVAKFLVYLRDADMVVGTRTTRQMLEQGTNMRGIVRAAHIFLAKLAELLWWRFDPRFTDICCVYRGLWRSVYETIRDHLDSPGAEIYPEMVIETLRARRRIIEIPINYYNRDVGQPFVRGRYQSVAMFRRVCALMLRKRLAGVGIGRWSRRARRPPAAVRAVQEADDETAREEAARYRRLERAWQNDVGYALLDKPYEVPGSAAVFFNQWDRLIAHLDPRRDGMVIEVGCGKGHFLERVRASGRAPRALLAGVDISRAVASLRTRGLAGIQADGEHLPFRDATAAYVFFDGALHHVIDYPAAVREAVRVLAPGGTLVLYEPRSTWFNQFAHRLLDPIVFSRSRQYESPIDIRYKAAFQQRVIANVLRDLGLEMREQTSDFLAYPFTGCYAGSVFSRSERFMRLLLTLEDWIDATPALNRLARLFGWRFTIVATKGSAAMARAAASPAIGPGRVDERSLEHSSA